MDEQHVLEAREMTAHAIRLLEEVRTHLTTEDEVPTDGKPSWDRGPQEKNHVLRVLAAASADLKTLSEALQKPDIDQEGAGTAARSSESAASAVLHILNLTSEGVEAATSREFSKLEPELANDIPFNHFYPPWFNRLWLSLEPHLRKLASLLKPYST